MIVDVLPKGEVDQLFLDLFRRRVVQGLRHLLDDELLQQTARAAHLLTERFGAERAADECARAGGKRFGIIEGVVDQHMQHGRELVAGRLTLVLFQGPTRPLQQTLTPLVGPDLIGRGLGFIDYRILKDVEIDRLGGAVAA